MNRLQWQQLAERWLIDAKSLLDDRRWSTAYYVAGYAVECGLKACVLARVAATPEVIFDDRKFSEKCWTHSIRGLIDVAGLTAVLAADTAVNPRLTRNWSVAKEWRETSRYDTSTHWQAKKLYRSITDKANGVMSWIRVRW